MALFPADEQAAGAAINIRKLLTGVPHRWGIDDGHHLFNVTLNKAVEQGFVGILDGTQINVFIQRLVKRAVLHISTFDLFFDGFVTGR